MEAVVITIVAIFAFICMGVHSLMFPTRRR